MVSFSLILHRPITWPEGKWDVSLDKGRIC